MKKKPKITIIVPVFNVEKFVGACVKSIQQQTYTDFECFLVNDGTPDESIEIARKLVSGDDRFVILEQENKGVSAARNLGISKAHGDYLIFVDSDDYVLENYLEAVVKLVEKHSCDALVFNHCLLKDGRFYGEHKRYLIKGEEVVSQSEALRCFLKGIIGLSSCSIVFDRKVLSKLRFETSLAIAEDALLNANYLLECESVLLSNQSFYVYRQDSGGVTKTGFSKKKYEMAQSAFRQIESVLRPQLRPSQYGVLYAFIFRHLLGHVVKAGSGDVKSPFFSYFFYIVKNVHPQDFDNWKHLIPYIYYRYVVKGAL